MVLGFWRRVERSWEVSWAVRGGPGSVPGGSVEGSWGVLVAPGALLGGSWAEGVRGKRFPGPPKTAQDGPSGPKTPQDGPKIAQGGPKRPPRRAKRPPRRPKRPPRRPQRPPRRPQDCPKTGQDDPTTANWAKFGACTKMYKNLRKINDFGGPGGVPEAPWGLLGASWSLLEASWGLLWASWGVLAASWTRRWRPRGPKTTQDRPTGGPRRPQDGPKTPLGCVTTIRGGSREGSGSHFGRPGSPGEGGRGVGKQVEEGSRRV